MPVPKRKRSKARRDKRFANKGLKALSLSFCSQCKEAIKPHTACQDCGFYKGAKSIKTKDERGQERKEKQMKKTQEAESEA